MHTPHRRPRRWSNESNFDPIFDSPNKNEPKTSPVFVCPCRGVLHTPLHGHAGGRMKLIPIRFLILRIKTNQNPDKFLSDRVGAYCIRPTNGHASGQMDRKIAIFQVAHVGAYCISPIDGHARGRMNLILIRFLIPRIKTNQNPDKFLSDRVGAYCIRPTDGHTGGRMNPIPIRFFIPRIKMNLKPAGFSIPRVKRNPIPAGFSIPRIKMNWKPTGFFNPGPKGMGVPGA